MRLVSYLDAGTERLGWAERIGRLADRCRHRPAP